jgi:hypothetical protein
MRLPIYVAAELLAYLSRHPNAADTLEGIMNWWLPRQRYETERRRIGSRPCRQASAAGWRYRLRTQQRRQPS